MKHFIFILNISIHFLSFLTKLLPLRRSGARVDLNFADKSLFRSTSISHKSIKIPFASTIKRFLRIFNYMRTSAHQSPLAIHIYVVPIYIILAPFVSLLCNSRYIIICQGQLEGEGKLVSYIYRLLLSLSSLFSLSCYS